MTLPTLSVIPAKAGIKLDPRFRGNDILFYEMEHKEKRSIKGWSPGLKAQSIT